MRASATLLALTVEGALVNQGHASSIEAYADGLDWLAAKLGVGKSIVIGANAGS